MLVDYLNKNDLTYATVLKQFNIPNDNKVLSEKEKEKVNLTGFEFEQQTGMSGNTGIKDD